MSSINDNRRGSVLRPIPHRQEGIMWIQVDDDDDDSSRSVENSNM